MEWIDRLIVLLCRFFLYPFSQFRNPASDFFQQSVLLPYQTVFLKKDIFNIPAEFTIRTDIE